MSDNIVALIGLIFIGVLICGGGVATLALALRETNRDLDAMRDTLSVIHASVSSVNAIVTTVQSNQKNFSDWLQKREELLRNDVITILQGVTMIRPLASDIDRDVQTILASMKPSEVLKPCPECGTANMVKETVPPTLVQAIQQWAPKALDSKRKS
jgi:hypothetical protein